MMRPFLFPNAGFLQFEVKLGDSAANLRKVRVLLEQLNSAENTILVLPELWATGFDYPHIDDLVLETPGLLEKLRQMAQQYGVCFAGSLFEKAEHESTSPMFYNTLYLTGPEGILGYYRKQHPFAFWQEDRFIVPGDHPLPMATPSGLVGGLVCYDLRFPDLAVIQAFQGARLIVVTAQWPRARLDHWQILIRARAIENQVFIAACNSCGVTGQKDFGGHSMVVGPDGTVLAEAGRMEEAKTVALVEEDLERLRFRFCSAGERPYSARDRKKIVSQHRLREGLAAIRRQGSRVAFTNGCFDILHSGHVAYLEQARKTADCLVVGLNSDRSVRSIKGNGRPVNGEFDRARVLAALGCVDFVVIFDEDTPFDLITSIMPDVLVKGADWPEDRIVGASEVKASGGRVVRIAFENQASTSAVISRIQQQSRQSKDEL